MNDLEKMLQDFIAKRAEIQAAHEKLVQFKAEVDEGMRKLNYLRIKVRKLEADGKIPAEVRALIDEALNG